MWGDFMSEVVRAREPAVELRGAAAGIRSDVLARWRSAFPDAKYTDEQVWDAHRTRTITVERLVVTAGALLDAIDALEARIKALEERNEPWKKSYPDDPDPDQDRPWYRR